MSNVSSQNEPRMSQILPTVKCSDCGRQVELRKLAIHLCSSVPPVPSFPNTRGFRIFHYIAFCSIQLMCILTVLIRLGIPAANPPPVDNRGNITKKKKTCVNIFVPLF